MPLLRCIQPTILVQICLFWVQLIVSCTKNKRRNTTGPPCRLTVHTCGGRPTRPPAVLQTTTDDSQQNKGGPVIIRCITFWCRRVSRFNDPGRPWPIYWRLDRTVCQQHPVVGSRCFLPVDRNLWVLFVVLETESHQLGGATAVRRLRSAAAVDRARTCWLAALRSATDCMPSRTRSHNHASRF